MTDAERIAEYKSAYPEETRIIELMIAQAALPPARDVRREIALETALRLGTASGATELLKEADKIFEWLKGA